ncbi:MAG: nuclear transport factor 2 family protein [Thermonemataceae bacterium]|mgnify:CR=1 FL=1
MPFYRNILFLLSFLIITCTADKSTRQPDLLSAKDEEASRYLKEVAWPKAYTEKDTVLLKQLLSERFVIIDYHGDWHSKQDELTWLKENIAQSDSFYYEIKRLEPLEDGTVILCGTGRFVRKADSLDLTYQTSNVFVKEDTRWKAVQSHVSGVKDTD